MVSPDVEAAFADALRTILAQREWPKKSVAIALAYAAEWGNVAAVPPYGVSIPIIPATPQPMNPATSAPAPPSSTARSISPRSAIRAWSP